MSKSRIENLKQSFILVFWKRYTEMIKNWTIFAQMYDSRQAHPYGYNCFVSERCPVQW